MSVIFHAAQLEQILNAKYSNFKEFRCHVLQRKDTDKLTCDILGSWDTKSSEFNAKTLLDEIKTTITPSITDYMQINLIIEYISDENNKILLNRYWFNIKSEEQQGQQCYSINLVVWAEDLPIDK